MSMLKDDIQKSDFTSFKYCNELSDFEKKDIVSKFTDVFDDIDIDLEKRFDNLNDLRDDLDLFLRPMNYRMTDRHKDIKYELLSLQTDTRLIDSDKREIEFWKQLSYGDYPLLTRFALKFYAKMGSTWLCETGLSFMNRIKSLDKISLTNEHLEPRTRMATTEIKINYEEVLAKDDS